MREDELMADRMEKVLKRDIPLAIHESSRIYRAASFFKQYGLSATIKGKRPKMTYCLKP